MTEPEIRGRLMAQAYWEELEKIAIEIPRVNLFKSMGGHALMGAGAGAALGGGVGMVEAGRGNRISGALGGAAMGAAGGAALGVGIGHAGMTAAQHAAARKAILEAPQADRAALLAEKGKLLNSMAETDVAAARKGTPGLTGRGYKPMLPKAQEAAK